MSPPKLLEIAVSHYCEKARWALDFHSIAYHRLSHVPLVARLVGGMHGVWHTVPVLFTDQGTLRESSAILAWADSKDEAAPLLSPDSKARQDIENWIKLFDTKLGPATRRLAYFHLIDHPTLVDPLLTERVGTLERKLVSPYLPMLKRLMKKGMRINAEGAESSRLTLKKLLEQVEQRLNEGHDFLVGHSFTGADLSFAALLAPILMPEAYGAKLPELSLMSPEGQAEVQAMRSSSVGQWALNLYQNHRGQPAKL